MTQSTLFSPVALRGLQPRNRLVVSPMCQYSAVNGFANDWHFAHLARFALGGFGIVMVEATAVTETGRITHGDLGLWNDAQIAPLARIAKFLRDNGAVPAIQLGHSGRRAASQRPWEGDGPLTEADAQAGGDASWPVVAASAMAHRPNYQVPLALDEASLEAIRSPTAHREAETAKAHRG